MHQVLSLFYWLEPFLETEGHIIQPFSAWIWCLMCSHSVFHPFSGWPGQGVCTFLRCVILKTWFSDRCWWNLARTDGPGAGSSVVRMQSDSCGRCWISRSIALACLAHGAVEVTPLPAICAVKCLLCCIVGVFVCSFLWELNFCFLSVTTQGCSFKRSIVLPPDCRLLFGTAGTCHFSFCLDTAIVVWICSC